MLLSPRKVFCIYILPQNDFGNVLYLFLYSIQENLIPAYTYQGCLSGFTFTAHTRCFPARKGREGFGFTLFYSLSVTGHSEGSKRYLATGIPFPPNEEQHCFKSRQVTLSILWFDQEKESFINEPCHSHSAWGRGRSFKERNYVQDKLIN